MALDRCFYLRSYCECFQDESERSLVDDCDKSIRAIPEKVYIETDDRIDMAFADEELVKILDDLTKNNDRTERCLLSMSEQKNRLVDESRTAPAVMPSSMQWTSKNSGGTGNVSIGHFPRKQIVGNCAA